VIFRYASYNENSHKGDYSCTINTRWHNGKPATGLPYELYYEDRHFGSINIKEGTIPGNGIIEITDVAGGDETHFTLEIDKGKLGRYLFQLPGKEKSRQLQYKIAPLEGNKAPDITVCDIFTGKEAKLSDFNDNVLFVEFWATWCGPCQEPMAHLCEIASNRKTDWGDKVMLLCLSLDDKKEDVKQYVSNRDWLGVRHLWCQENEPGFESFAAKTYGITGVPTALLIDQSGTIIWRGHPGSFDIEANIDKLLTNR
jgi:thiol-disulfide isomerase/thioredoxin